MTVTANLHEILESELRKKDFNEFHSGDTFELDNITFFDNEKSLMKKMLMYDDDIHTIVTDKFFIGNALKNPEHDKHFKKAFIHHFLTREINRQTVEAFSLQVSYTFMINEDYINRIYTDLEKYLASRQINKQSNSGSTLSDNRSAYSMLPQDNVHLDVNSTVMETANDNTISRNKQANEQNTNGETFQYRLDELFKTNGLLEQVFIQFDEKCFLQVW